MTDARTSDPLSNSRIQKPQGADALVIAPGGQLVLEAGAKVFSAGVDITNSLGTACIPIATGSITTPQAGLDFEIPAGYARVNIVGTSLKFAATNYLSFGVSIDGGDSYVATDICYDPWSVAEWVDFADFDLTLFPGDNESSFRLRVEIQAFQNLYPLFPNVMRSLHFFNIAAEVPPTLARITNLKLIASANPDEFPSPTGALLTIEKYVIAGVAS